MEVRHFLIEEGKNSTISACYIDGEFICYILEDEGRKDKIRGETRVDAGGPYQIKPVQSGNFYRVYKNGYGHQFALSVLGFKRHSAIMYHMLNTVDQTMGCFGPGLNVTRLMNGTHTVGNSKGGYFKIYEKLEKIFDPQKLSFTEDVLLYIHRENPWQLLKGEKRAETW